MKSKFYVVVLSFAILTSAFGATDKGGLFVEPFLTYENSDFDINYPSPIGDSEGDYKGAGIGARIGGHVYESLFIGADARYSKYDYNDDDNSYDSDASGYTYGPVVGLQLPTDLSIRIWWNWVLGGSIDPDAGDDFDVKFEDGHGYRIGAGIMFYNLSFNLEFQDIVYDKTKLEQAGPFSNPGTFSDVELENKGYVFSVSFPYTL